MDDRKLEAHLLEMQKHLHEVTVDPSKTLQRSITEGLDSSILVNLNNNSRQALLNQLSALLQTLQQDPTPATDLVSGLIGPDHVNFSSVLSIEPKVDFLTGLSAASPPINLITLELLRKASLTNSDVGIVAGMPDVVHALVHVWLCSLDLAVYQQAHSLLETFLIGANSNELMWRRVLGDKDIYGSIFLACSHQSRGQKGGRDEKDLTIAQGRLLALIARIDCPAIRTSQCPQIEKQYGVPNLVDFATLQMVDYQSDILMHMTLIQFFGDWLRESMKSATAGSLPRLESITSPALDYLIDKGLHSRTISYFTEMSSQSSLDASYLYSQAAAYLQVYFSLHPEHALGPGRGTLKSTFARISEVLDRTSPATFVGSPPNIELAVLANVPRVALLVRNFSSPSLLKLPIQPPSAAVFTSLSALFGGHAQHPSGNAASRILYFLYLKQRPDLWSTVSKAADTLALKDAAVAAGELVHAVIIAEWEPFGKLFSSKQLDESMFRLRSEEAFADFMGTQSLPQTGFLAVLTSPALEAVIPWLLQPAQRSSNLGVGGKGDVEGAANSVARVKYDALQALHVRLQEHIVAHGTNSEWQSILAQMGKRLAQGRWGGSTGVGGRIATTEH